MHKTESEGEDKDYIVQENEYVLNKTHTKTNNKYITSTKYSIYVDKV